MVVEVAEDLEVNFVKLGTMLGTKKSTGRPPDLDDAQNLRLIQEMNGP